MRPQVDLVIMDWGIGGLSVYNEIRKVLPQLSILYYSDSGRTPYGKMSSRELENRIEGLISDFSQSGVRHFVVACNAASTVLPKLEKKFQRQGLYVTGVIDRGLEMITKSKWQRVGVIGGRRTIRSQSYTRPFAGQKKIQVVGRIAQPLSALIEAGELNTPKMTSTLKTILAPLKSVDALVLACTHYPAVALQIQELLPKAKLLDPALSTALFVKRKWSWSRAKGPRGQVFFMTSGNSQQMKVAALRAFQVKISKVIAYR